MAYNEKLADRVREIIALTYKNIEEKKMFGGLCFMVNDKMCVGVEKERLMVRLDPAKYDEVMEKEGVKPMDFTGKVLKGYVFVDVDALKTKKQLEYWVGLALAYNKLAKISKKKKITMNTEVFKNVDEYINTLFVKEDQALLEVTASIETEGIPAISVSANQGKFLYLLAKLANAKKILELGTLAGYSTIWMARALPRDGKLITLEFDPKHAAVAKKNIGRANLASLVDIRVGKALDLLPQIEAAGEGPFDMIFIDADKPPYAEYFQWAVRLSRPGTLIIADNVIRDGKVLDQDSKDEMVMGVQRFNNMLAANKAVDATIIQTVGEKEHDGMALAIVK